MAGCGVSDRRVPMCVGARVHPTSSRLLFFFLLVTVSVLTIHASSPGKFRRSLDTLSSESEQQQDVGAQPRPPSLVRKMSDNAGEKFWPNYWDLEDLRTAERGPRDDNVVDPIKRDDKGEPPLDNFWTGNSSVVFRPPYHLHARELPFSFPSIGRSVLNLRSPFSLTGKRSFECPAGTSPCTSINRPNSCCDRDDTCQRVEDTGLGDVGCCAEGDDCSGQLVSCPEGYGSCPDSRGGGCCIPGYSCVDDGCLFVSTTTIIVTISPSSTSISTSTLTRTTAPAAPTASGSVDPPYRPTSNPISTATSTTTSSGTITSTTEEIPADCPTGFYACQAIYNGGCCRTGRDCNPTSCPTVPSTTITFNGATLVVPVEITAGPGIDSPSDKGCAEGWTSCAENAGGGCCPDGFQCGQTSCSASATGIGTGVIGKIPPENSGGRYALPFSEFGKMGSLVWMMIIWTLTNGD